MSHTQTTVRSVVLARIAILSLVRTVDFEKLAAESPDGKISLEDISTKGDYSITIDSQNSKIESKRLACASLAEGEGFFAGFSLAASLTKPPKSAEDKAADKARRAAKKAEKEAAAKAAAEAEAKKDATAFDHEPPPAGGESAGKSGKSRK